MDQKHSMFFEWALTSPDAEGLRHRFPHPDARQHTTGKCWCRPSEVLRDGELVTQHRSPLQRVRVPKAMPESV